MIQPLKFGGKGCRYGEQLYDRLLLPSDFCVQNRRVVIHILMLLFEVLSIRYLRVPVGTGNETLVLESTDMSKPSSPTITLYYLFDQ